MQYENQRKAVELLQVPLEVAQNVALNVHSVTHHVKVTMVASVTDPKSLFYLTLDSSHETHVVTYSLSAEGIVTSM